jgi:hypothetical protein
MAIPTWSKEGMERAKAEKLTLFKLEINTKFSGGVGVAMSGICGPKTRKKLEKLFLALSKPDERLE